jgi:inosose dehydratase
MPYSPIRVAVNPLPWKESGSDLSRAMLLSALTELRDVGFTALHAEVPAEMTVPEYRHTLADHGFEPAPGYFSAEFSDPSSTAEIFERARRAAAVQAELGLSEIFIAAAMTEERWDHPAVGYQEDQSRLAQITEALVGAAEAMHAEGVTPALHSHVGTWVESESEIRSVLDGSAGSALAFGPDTGHLFWGGADPAALVKEYADRVACVHIKDVDAKAAADAAQQQVDYRTATHVNHVWTEPGRGDVDIDGVIAALPEDFSGWAVIEVDVPNLPSRVESARASLNYLRANPAFAQ